MSELVVTLSLPCGDQTDMMAILGDCAGYAICVHGSAVRQSCSEGTLFDPAVNEGTCVWADQAIRPDC